MATFFRGISFPLFKIVATGIGAVPLSFILEACVTFTALAWIRVAGKRRHSLAYLVRPAHLRHDGILATLLIGGTLFSNYVIRGMSVFLLSLLGNLQSIVTLFLSIWTHQEKRSRKQQVGIALVFLSIAAARL